MWDLSLLHELFQPKEVKVITNMPISPFLPPDRLIWQGTKNGSFSVRSAYHLGMELQDRSRGQSSTVVKEPEVWNSLWNLKVPNAIKIFMWRSFNNILPTKQNLLKKRIVDDGRCPWCLDEIETISHALWYCTAAQDVWSVGQSPLQKCAFIDFTFMEIFMECCSRFEVEQMAIFTVLARRIWFRRNAMLFEGKSEHPKQIYREVVTAAADFIDNNSGEESAVEPVRHEVSIVGSWTHPPSGIVKINFDAAVDQQKGMVGIGVVARDSVGFLLGAKRFSIHIFTDPHTA